MATVAIQMQDWETLSRCLMCDSERIQAGGRGVQPLLAAKHVDMCSITPGRR